MAKITITTDDGEVVDRWTDSADGIGNLDKQMNRHSMAQDIQIAVNRARKKDNRDVTGMKLSPPHTADDI